MATIGRSLSERFGRWQVLAGNLRESPAAGAILDDELAEIESLLAEARDLQDQQARLRSRSQEITRRLNAIAGRGDAVRRRMGAVLRGKLGHTSEELVRYSFRPRKLPVRRRAAAPALPSAESSDRRPSLPAILGGTSSS